MKINNVIKEAKLFGYAEALLDIMIEVSRNKNQANIAEIIDNFIIEKINSDEEIKNNFIFMKNNLLEEIKKELNTKQ